MLLAVVTTVAFTAAGNAQSWEHEVEVDEVSLAEIHTASVRWRVGYRQHAMIVRCSPHLEAYVIVADFAGSSRDTSRVEYRFDSEGLSTTEQWSNSTTGTALFAPARSVSALIARLETNSDLFFRWFDFRDTPATLEVSLTGSSSALSRLPCAADFLIDADPDGDGVRNADDLCDDAAEDFDGVGDEDGCPETDNDGDGIEDTEDNCPNDAEDFDTFEDVNGCPDLDNDSDSVEDDDDNCPFAANVEQLDTDNDGLGNACDNCPGSMDDDGDGVCNDVDNCVETPNASQEDADSNGRGRACDSNERKHGPDPIDDACIEACLDTLSASAGDRGRVLCERRCE
ncbi:MAG: hypothetical protein ACI81R_002795 [Bradymonadia bacterium]|jgi:hypothetical protein